MIFLVESEELVQRFIDKGMHLTPDALDEIEKFSEQKVGEVLSRLNERKDQPTVVDDSVISKVLSSEETIPATTPETESVSEIEESSEEEEISIDSEGEEPEGSPEGLEAVEGVEVLKEVTGKSTSEGEVEDFVQLFQDRYEKLSTIVRSREGFQNYTELENIFRHEGDVVNLVGLVNSKRETRKKDAWLVELEDPTGRVMIYIKDSERNEEVIEKVKRVVTDEVVGFKAKVPDDLRSGNRSPLVWGNELVWPDIPHSNSSSGKEDQSVRASGYAVLISDLHVGSSMFLPEVFNKFLEWLKGEAGNDKQIEMAKKVKYLIIAGDLVDGIGVYPGQQDELEIDNIEKQYEKVAGLLSRVPDDIEIIAAPGNHDAARGAVPQPSFSSDVVEPLRDLGVNFVGNPAYLSIEGVKFLIYHGRGFNDLISADPELEEDDISSCMTEVIRRRHLAPIYGDPMGGRTPLAPEDEDYLVIDEVPDVFHCGHLHRYACEEYRGVLMINSATFQEQTIFMKRQGIVPTPGRVPIVDLKTKEARAINFA